MVVGHTYCNDERQYLAVCGVGVKAALHQSVHIPGQCVCVYVCVVCVCVVCVCSLCV